MNEINRSMLYWLWGGGEVNWLGGGGVRGVGGGH